MAIVGQVLIGLELPFVLFSPLNAVITFIINQCIGFVRESFREWSRALPNVGQESHKQSFSKTFINVTPLTDKEQG